MPTPDHLHYLLDEKGEPYQVHDVREWAAKFPEQHHVKWDEILLLTPYGERFIVSTAFLGIKGIYHLVGKVRLESIPMLFETVVFDAAGNWVDASMYDELDQARSGHQRTLARWRKSLGVDPA